METSKKKEQWKKGDPLLESLSKLEECFWENPNKVPFDQANKHTELTMDNILDAQARLKRFAPYFEAEFPETKATHGIIESPLKEIPHMQKKLWAHKSEGEMGKLFVKCDSHLPISGSIKARGGFYEILKFAEDIAIKEKMLHETDCYSILSEERFKRMFSQYRVAVGSTGNLGLSIGIISAKLGFKVTVHMSADARSWKKEMLRDKGVTVKEYDDDYSLAVAEGRKQAENDPYCYFVDDENSTTLFLGYTVAALRLKTQLEEKGIYPDKENPLFVYLPCGVGGGPGGVAFGLKQVYKDAVHCFFAEPTHAPCMTLGLMTGLHDKICVQDIGIDNKTAADGLAVGRASSFVGRTIEPFLGGAYTITDENMFRLLAAMIDTENIALEPSALASVAGPAWLCNTQAGDTYIKNNHLEHTMHQAVHICWATGGSMVPKSVMDAYYEKGKQMKK